MKRTGSELPAQEISISVILTGIKPTGIPHLGNYFGAIRPALAAARQPDRESRFFIADVHALNQGVDGPVLRSATFDVAAAWLACGLDPRSTLIYRRSDVPEILELAVFLTPLAPKGLMNRAHAYKAKAAENRQAGRDPDEGVNMGLYTYPILMAADILAFDTDLVPVGSDQVQHVEMTVELARAANRRWGAGTLKEPRAGLPADPALVPGTDGRKMSKSYGNVIPLCSGGGTLAGLIRKVPTDSLPAEAPKDPEANPLAAWYRYADPAAAEDFERRLKAGMGWGEAKAEVAQVLERVLAPVADRFHRVRADEGLLQTVLGDGAQRARSLAQTVLQRVRRRVF